MPLATVIGPGAGRPFLGGLARSLVASSDADCSAFAQDLPAQSPPVPADLRAEYDEAFYVLDGDVWITDGDEDRVVEPGAFVLVRKGVRHRFWNPTARPARMLVIGHLEVQALVEEVAPHVQSGGLDAVIAAFKKYRSRIVE